jgi:saccharopine dehydrogenase (NADP+, L-glutamate forming)
MLELEKEVKEAGITVMNEIGGIDHLYAVKTVTEVHKAGGKITSFLSYCGGLPAPEASDNPLQAFPIPTIYCILTLLM